MSVDLRGLQTGVAQQLLDHTQVGASIQQVGGEAVAQGMGVGGHRRAPIEDPPDVTGADPAAPAIEEEGPALLGGRRGAPPGAPAEATLPRGPSSQAPTTSAHRWWISTCRCFEPLPTTVTTRRSRSTSPVSSEHSSATRIPAP